MGVTYSGGILLTISGGANPVLTKPGRIQLIVTFSIIKRGAAERARPMSFGASAVIPLASTPFDLEMYEGDPFVVSTYSMFRHRILRVRFHRVDSGS